MIRFAALLFLALTLCGCAGVGTAPDFQVRIDVVEGRESHGFGHGVLVGPRTVVTVAHVVPGPAAYYVSRANFVPKPRYVHATFVRIIGLGASIEPLSVLRLAEPMACDRYPELRGVEPGDSGSPIMGKRGNVIGFVHGYMDRFMAPGRTIFGVNGPLSPDLIGKEE